jgi:hypothetical protein
VCSASGGSIRGLQSEPVMRRAHLHTSGASLLQSSMRKGEPKSSLGLTRLAFHLRTPWGAELPHATSTPGGASPSRLPCSLSFPGFIRASAPRPFKAGCGARTLASGCVSRQMRNLRVGDLRVLRSTIPGNKDHFLGTLVCRCLGEKSVPGKLAGIKGKPPLTAKSLSANTV